MNTTIDANALAQTIATAVTTAVIAALNGDAPATQAPAKTTRKTGSRKVTSKAPKGAAKHEWNHKFGQLMRACPAGSYRAAMDRWDEAQALRDAGKTPAQARTAMGFKVSR